MWYVFYTTIRDDEELQKKGLICILYNIGPKARTESKRYLKKLRFVRAGLPKRVAGAHYCFDQAWMRPFVAGVRLLQDKESRTRFRAHYGTSHETQFNLMTYGIDTKNHPITENGELFVGWHTDWVQIQSNREESAAESDIILVPRRFDVLFGRGKNTREHTGNLRAAHMVEMHRDEYEKAGKFQKTEVAQRIVRMVNDSYGRFLKWEGGKGWVEVDNEVARDKISHFFRHARSKTVDATKNEATKRAATTTGTEKASKLSKEQ